jgi:hypothetical protein
MGETRVDLVHLLEDLRDAYIEAVEETILSEAIANSLDSRASRIAMDLDPGATSITIRDNGTGMSRAELRRYHDLARSSKERGEGIGFAGVGIKLGLLISSEVWTESARSDHSAIATQWKLASKHKAPWRFCEALLEEPPIYGGLRASVSRRLDGRCSRSPWARRMGPSRPHP